MTVFCSRSRCKLIGLGKMPCAGMDYDSDSESKLRIFLDLLGAFSFIKAKIEGSSKLREASLESASRWNAFFPSSC